MQSCESSGLLNFFALSSSDLHMGFFSRHFRDHFSAGLERTNVSFMVDHMMAVQCKFSIICQFPSEDTNEEIEYSI